MEDDYKKALREAERRIKKEQEDKAFKKRCSESAQRINETFDRIIQMQQAAHNQHIEALQLRLRTTEEQLRETEERVHKKVDALLRFVTARKKVIRDEHGRISHMESDDDT
jgi:hypothetical protein